MSNQTNPQISQKKHYWLYVLGLDGGKYYVGVTSRQDPQERIDQHKAGYYSAQWVKKYGYRETLEIRELGFMTKAEAERRELEVTREYMEKFGMNNVRGGGLNYRGNYFARFGHFYPDFAWEAITTVVLLLLIIIGLEAYIFLHR